MPRTVSSCICVELPAHVTWRLRSDFRLEQKIAALGNRKLRILEEKYDDAGTDGEKRYRIVQCDLINGDRVFGFRPEDLSSRVFSTCFVNRHDHLHGATFSVELATKRLSVAISGRQWCVPIDDTSCHLHTLVEVNVDLFGLGSIAEAQIEKKLRASHEAFPQHAINHLRSLAPLPSIPESNNESNTESNINARDREVSQAKPKPTFPKEDANPRSHSLNGGRFFFDAVTSRRRLRHSALREEKNITITVPRRYARVILLFGCAKQVDEIVE